MCIRDRVGTDEAALAAVFDSFVRWQTLRVVMNIGALVSTLWAVALLV